MDTLAAQLAKLAVRSADTAWAARVPLVHFPAGHTFTGGPSRAGVSSWTSLESPRSRGGKPTGGSHNAKLTANHVFFFAGCAAFSGRAPVGDCALYLRPSAEDGARGSASPFDSGALIAPKYFHLEPWRGAGADEAARVSDFGGLCVDLSSWRRTFEEWLARCYDEPRRYLASSPNRATAGRPDATVPPELAQSQCDRRAWTWEVRIEGEVSFEHLAVLHVPQAVVPVAWAWARERGLTLAVVSYETADEIASPDALFDASEHVVQTYFLSQ